jgi:hydroxymethylbilane synthase
MIIGSRQSDLAKIQAFAVGDAIQKAHPTLPIQYFFRQAQGDVDLKTPLWRSPAQGVFTQDLRSDLLAGRCDLVVHSWKDLPTADDPDTEVVGTLPRADLRDLILFKADLQRGSDPIALVIQTSSPRREHNLSQLLPELLPRKIQSLEFRSIRGNVQTRLRKWASDPETHGLVLAKAAVDRILLSRQSEFLETRELVQKHLASSFVVILPWTAHPSAAAQGALALQVRKADAAKYKELFAGILDRSCFWDVNQEREKLQSYGGGCHLKIGVSQKTSSFGTHFVAKGLTPNGVSLAEESFVPQTPIPSESKSGKVFWSLPEYFVRKKVALPESLESTLADKLVVISRSQAWPEGLSSTAGRIRLAAGVESWKRLAKRGVWIHGCLESYGTSQVADWESLFQCQAIHLTHEREASQRENALATYRMEVDEETLKTVEWNQYTHFYWSSYTLFEAAVNLVPELLSRYHHCGMGATHAKIRSHLGPKGFLWGWPGPDSLKNFLSKP